jgi:hypothetical protein
MCKKHIKKGKAKIFQKNYYCSTCNDKLDYPICKGCKKKIVNYTIYLGQTFCFDCAETSDKCYSCGMPIGRNYALQKGKKSKMCFKCTQETKINDQTVPAIFDEIRSDAAKYFDIQIPAIPIYLVIFEELQSLINWIALKAVGVYRGRDEGIYIVPYYPEEYFKIVLFHEAIHAWQDYNCNKSNFKIQFFIDLL